MAKENVVYATVTCEKCNQEIQVSSSDIKEKAVGRNLHHIYYHCPVCRAKYIIAKTDKYIRELQRKLKICTTFEQMMEIKEEIKVAMDKLNRKTERYTHTIK
jgi:uncharacterized protein with PIN domain